MKKILMTVAAMAAMVGFAGQDDLLVTLSAKEMLTYKNNEKVNNEVVALVWTPAGATFGGFLANGLLKDTDTSKVLARIVVKDGLFETTTFQIDADFVERMKLTQGAFALYLLDTRDASGKTAVENGAKDLAQATIPVNYTAKILEGSADASAGGIATSIESDGTEAKIVAEGQTELPVDITALTPIIKSVKVEGDKFKVTIEKAVPYMKYDLIDASSKEAIGDSAQSGVVSETITLETSMSEPTKLIQVSAGRNQ